MKKIIISLVLTLIMGSTIAATLSTNSTNNPTMNYLPTSHVSKSLTNSLRSFGGYGACRQSCSNDFFYCRNHGGTIQSCAPEYADCIDRCNFIFNRGGR